MLRRIVAKMPGIGSLAAGLLLLCSGSAAAQTTEVWLRAEALTKIMPGGRVVPMWGFALTDSSFATGVATVPGPAITVAPGTGLVVHLQNLNIPEGISIDIPGQAPPTDGATRQPPVRDASGRARSFAHETATGATADYAWDTIRPGTYLYQSGSHPAVQVQMGLYGALECDTAAGDAYGVAASQYTQALVLLYSEIDPGLHDAVAAGQYGPAGTVTSTIDYGPRYFLVNGEPFAPGLSPLPVGAPGSTTLLRFLNAGLLTHLPSLGGGSELTLLAEDGNLAPFARRSTQVELSAGKTVDATLVVPGPGYYALYDRKLSLANGKTPGGGMLVYLAVPGGATAALTVAKDGTGAGRVATVSAPGGVDCGLDCTESYNAGTLVTLRAYPRPSSLLTGWTGGGPRCTGMGDCVTRMDAAKTVTATFTSYAAVTVAAPNGGEVFPERSIQTIRWGGPASAVTFTLHYSVDRGASWKPIARGIAGKSFVWTLPSVAATLPGCMVRVRGYDATDTFVGADVSNAAFVIRDIPVTVVSPNGGEGYRERSVQTVEWSGPDWAVSFVLHYSLDGGATWDLIGRGIVGRSHAWTLPLVGTTSRNCLVRVTGTTAGGERVGVDVSNAPFTIRDVPLAVVSPNGGEVYPEGSAQTIEWDAPGFAVSFTLNYSVDGGRTWRPIGGAIAGRIYAWTVPNVGATRVNSLVRVTGRTAANELVDVDASNAPFTIQNVP